MNKCCLLICLIAWHFFISIMGQSLDVLPYDDKAISIIRQNASNFASQGLYANAISLEKRLSTYFLNYGEMGDYAISLSIIAAYYSDSGEYEQALNLSKKALGHISDTTHIDKEGRFEIVQHHAMFCENIGNHEDALHYGKLSVELAKTLTDSVSYPKSLTFLAFVYSELGDFHRAISLCSEAKMLYEKNGKIENDEYLTTINDLGAYYCGIGDLENAITIGSQYIKELKRRKLDSQQRYIVALNNLARYLAVAKKNQEAIELSLQALQLINKSCNTNSYLKGRTLEHLSTFSANIGDFTGAKKYLEYAIFYFSKVWKKNRPGMVNEYRNHIRLSYLCDSLSHVESEVVNVGHNVTDLVRTAFSYLPNSGRNQFWDNYYRSWYIEEFPFYVYNLRTTALIEEGYNSVLFSKGILLNTEIGVKQLIESSNDSIVQSKFNKLQQSMASYLSGDGNSSNDSILWDAEDEEASLLSLCKSWGNHTKRLRVNWKDIKDVLFVNDIAIEFLSFPTSNDSVMYVALTLRKDSETPKMTVLFEEKQLKEVSDTIYYQCREMADLVWKPLQSELKGIKNIYFSPAGALYNIGIEYLPGMEDYNIYRLSSTRELAVNKPQETGNNAVLYGGLDYYAELDSSSTNKDLSQVDNPFLVHANVRDLNLRGGQGYLPESKVEVERIGKEFNKANKPCLLFTEKVGTEESFKALSGKKISNLHISTHGFYYTQEKADSIDYEFLRLRDDLSSAEDKSLTRSGLLMAGANHILEGDTLPDNVEDGILTAKEIANVDLRGLDLVVLSACQTGLGDIAQGEGVFGLQRGFKKAGANTILMSLWKVDDEATQILMTQFYKNLVAGQTKRQSLLSAQKYLRMYKNEKGELCYNEPKYWAAFILLDGIDS